MQAKKASEFFVPADLRTRFRLADRKIRGRRIALCRNFQSRAGQNGCGQLGFASVNMTGTIKKEDRITEKLLRKLRFA